MYKGLPLVSLLSLPSLEPVGVKTCSTGHSPVQELFEWGVCGLRSAFAEDHVCTLALSSVGRFVICVDFGMLPV